MLTDAQKIDLAELVRKILTIDLPREVRSEMLSAFYDWPDSPDFDPEDLESQSDGYDAREIMQREIDAHERAAWVCGLCGAKEPKGFLVPDPVWEFYIGSKFRFACVACYSALVERTDGGAFQDQHGRPATLRWFGTAEDPQNFPLPPGGFEQLQKMTETERGAFFSFARGSGYWDWLKTDRSGVAP